MLCTSFLRKTEGGSTDTTPNHPVNVSALMKPSVALIISNSSWMLVEWILYIRLVKRILVTASGIHGSFLTTREKEQHTSAGVESQRNSLWGSFHFLVLYVQELVIWTITTAYPIGRAHYNVDSEISGQMESSRKTYRCRNAPVLQKYRCRINVNV